MVFYQVHRGGRISTQVGPGCLTTVASSMAFSTESKKGVRHLAATWAERWRPLMQCIRICSPRQMAWRLQWVTMREPDLGKHKPCWRKLGPNLCWGLTWLRPPWKHVSGLKLLKNRSPSPTDLTQKNPNQRFVLPLAQIHIKLLRQARSRNLDEILVGARSHPFVVDVQGLTSPDVRASA